MRYRFGDHTLDTSTLQLLTGGTEVDLEPQAFAVLSHLVAERDRVVPKEELFDVVWGSRFVSESALTTRIKQVRKALGDTGRTQTVVRTFHGRGYRFVARVDEDADREEPRLAGGSQPTTRRRLPRTRYAESQGASIAYQTFGDGPDLVLVAGYATNVEAQWSHPDMAAFLDRLGTIARVTVLDKRGVGVSDRLAHDNVLPLEDRADDLTAVLDAAGVEHATILGSSEGGSLSAVFAASHPDRVERLVLHNTWVTGPVFSPRRLDLVVDRWGSGRVYATLAPALAAAPGGRELLASYERQSATPRTARALLEMIARIDIAGILDAITVPTLVLHRSGDQVVPVAHGEQLAAGIRGARFVVLDGEDHYLYSGDPTRLVAEIQRFIADTPTAIDATERVLATVLAVGTVSGDGPDDTDRRTRLLAEIADAEIERQRGRLVSATADGVLATFDGPGRAVGAAAAICDAAPRAGLTVRAGLHTAEIQCRGAEIAGIGVHIARRIRDAALPHEVWVSRTLTDLVAGTRLEFESRGEYVFDEIDRPWTLSALVR